MPPLQKWKMRLSVLKLLLVTESLLGFTAQTSTGKFTVSFYPGHFVGPDNNLHFFGLGEWPFEESKRYVYTEALVKQVMIALNSYCHFVRVCG